jgi:hypothetical protein
MTMLATDITGQIDDLIEEIHEIETRDDVVLYLEKKQELEAGINELRMRAQEEGNFQTRFFIFKKITRVVYDWKKIVEKLYRDKRLTDADIEPFKQEKIYGEARRITSSDSEVTV